MNSPHLTGSQSDLVRADLVFFETPAGGAVFSTGSIAWIGSLSHNGYDNNVVPHHRERAAAVHRSQAVRRRLGREACIFAHFTRAQIERLQ